MLVNTIMTVTHTAKFNTPSESRAYASQCHQHLMRNVNTNTLAFIELKSHTSTMVRQQCIDKKVDTFEKIKPATNLDGEDELTSKQFSSSRNAIEAEIFI